jgi:hypothetical protein
MKYHINYINNKAYLSENPPELVDPMDKLRILVAILKADENSETIIDRKSINIPDEYKNRPILDLVRSRPPSEDD